MRSSGSPWRWPIWIRSRSLQSSIIEACRSISATQTPTIPSMAAPVLNLPNLAEPVTFTGPDAERFAAELPAALSRDEEARLRESVRAAEASMTSTAANAAFAK